MTIIYINNLFIFLGFFYFDEFKTFVVKRNLPFYVAVSEDATRIITRVEYDHSTNQLVGLVSPLDENGMPKKLFFPAKSASLIVNYLSNNSKANCVIVVMAQSLSKGKIFYTVAFT